MTIKPILVLGGTGKTGRRVVSRLQQRGHEVRAASRRGPTRFDWNDENTWEPVLKGVGAAYLVDSQLSDAVAELLQQARGLERCRAAGAAFRPRLGSASWRGKAPL